MKAKRLHCVTDQGNGGAYCSNCGYDLTDRYPYITPNPCKGCGLEWEDTPAEPYSFGGSDF